MALGGIIACGVVYAIIGLIVSAVGTKWIETLMPPVVTGAIVCVIGLNLAPIAVKGVSGSNFDSWMALVTVLCVAAVAVFARGMLQRLLILVGLLIAYVIYAIVTNGLGMGKPIDFSIVANAAWFGMPHFTAPVFNAQAMALARADRGDPRRGKSRPHQGGERDDWPEPRPLCGPRVHRRWARDDRLGLRRRHRRHDLRGKHRRDGRHQNLLDARVRDRRA